MAANSMRRRPTGATAHRVISDGPRVITVDPRAADITGSVKTQESTENAP